MKTPKIEEITVGQEQVNTQKLNQNISTVTAVFLNEKRVLVFYFLYLRVYIFKHNFWTNGKFVIKTVFTLVLFTLLPFVVIIIYQFLEIIHFSWSIFSRDLLFVEHVSNHQSYGYWLFSVCELRQVVWKINILAIDDIVKYV